MNGNELLDDFWVLLRRATTLILLRRLTIGGHVLTTEPLSVEIDLSHVLRHTTWGHRLLVRAVVEDGVLLVLHIVKLLVILVVKLLRIQHGVGVVIELLEWVVIHLLMCGGLVEVVGPS